MPSPNEPKMLTPDGLVNQLFDGALKQNPTDPRMAARQVISFLTNALLYALASSKSDPVVFLTEALVDVIGATNPGDAEARKEVLKHISGMLASAAEQAPVAQQPPTTPQTPGKP